MKKLLLLFYSLLLLPIILSAQDIQFCVDVSMNRDTMFFGVADSTNTNNPAEGSDFVIQGPIYRAGTFSLNGNDSGLLDGGDSEFPNQKIGHYISRGWFIQDPQDTDGILALTKQVFFIDTEYQGLQPFQLVVSGKEPAALNDPITRAIIGATDELMTFRGQAIQENVGINTTDGFNTTFCFGMINLIEPVSAKTIQEKEFSVEMALFPNPATSQITVNVDNTSNPFQGQIMIMDLLGRSLIEDSWFLHEEENSKMLNTSMLQPGMYLVLLKDQNNIISSQKLIISKK
jgi:Secretion system C-terminal sorting domain